MTDRQYWFLRKRIRDSRRLFREYKALARKSRRPEDREGYEKLALQEARGLSKWTALMAELA